MGWSAYAKNKFFAPKLAELTECGARELSIDPSESAQWLPTFVLVSVFQSAIPDPTRQLTFSFLRRVDAAIIDYANARAQLAAYLEPGGKRSISAYSRSLHSFETATAAAFQAFQLVKQLLPAKPRLFEREDGSPLQRLDRIYNATKHADEWIANGERSAPDSTLPVWLTNDGFEVKGYALAFEEFATEIETLAAFARHLTAPNEPSVPNEKPSDSNPHAI